MNGDNVVSNASAIPSPPPSPLTPLPSPYFVEEEHAILHQNNGKIVSMTKARNNSNILAVSFARRCIWLVPIRY